MKISDIHLSVADLLDVDGSAMITKNVHNSLDVSFAKKVAILLMHENGYDMNVIANYMDLNRVYYVRDHITLLQKNMAKSPLLQKKFKRAKEYINTVKIDHYNKYYNDLIEGYTPNITKYLK